MFFNPDGSASEGFSGKTLTRDSVWDFGQNYRPTNLPDVLLKVRLLRGIAHE